MKLKSIHRYPVKSMRGETPGAAQVERQGLAGDRRYMLVDEQGNFITAREVPALLAIRTMVTDDGLQLTLAGHGSVDVATPGEQAQRAMVSVWGDEVPARIADVMVNDWLSRSIRQPVRLAYLSDPTARCVDRSYGGPDDVVSFADGFPLLLTTEASLDDLNGRIAERRMDVSDGLVMDRFRPNLVISGSAPWDEDCWRLVRIGAVRFRVVKPCSRCVLTTRDPVTGEKTADNEPLRTLGSFHRGRDGGIMFGQNIIPIDRGEIRVGDMVEVLERGPSNV
ncbi:MAG TPA: MOSC domain-containing protein [Hyphomicrobiaceae bacterium]|nr:MOSC domain-containing protein [Hyphomicrobiaceae bacterium]